MIADMRDPRRYAVWMVPVLAAEFLTPKSGIGIAVQGSGSILPGDS